MTEKARTSHRRRKMPLRVMKAAIDNGDEVDLDNICDALKERHEVYLKKVSNEQLINLLIRVAKHASIKTKKREKRKQQDKPVQLQEKSAKKEEMVSFEAPAGKSLLGPLPSLPKSIPSALPPVKLDKINSILEPKNKQETKDPKPQAETKSRTAVEKKDAIDLNKLGDSELSEAKKNMDVDFLKAKISKEDPRFVYDVKKDFGPAVEANDWDSDESSPIVEQKVSSEAPKPVAISESQKLDAAKIPVDALKPVVETIKPEPISQPKEAVNQDLNQSKDTPKEDSSAGYEDDFDDDIDAVLDSLGLDDSKTKSTKEKTPIINPLMPLYPDKPAMAVPKVEPKKIEIDEEIEEDIIIEHDFGEGDTESEDDAF